MNEEGPCMPATSCFPHSQMKFGIEEKVVRDHPARAQKTSEEKQGGDRKAPRSPEAKASPQKFRHPETPKRWGFLYGNERLHEKQGRMDWPASRRLAT